MPWLFVPSHHDVAQDVFREAARALEHARLGRRQRELEDAIVAVTVVRALVGETATGRRGDLLDLPAEAGDGGLETLADRAKTLFVRGRGHEVHELVRSHLIRRVPFPGFAAGLGPGAKRRRGAGPRRSCPLYGSRGRAASSLCPRQRLGPRISGPTAPGTARPAT